MKYIDSEKLIDEIERRMEERNDVRNADDWYWPESDFWIRDKEDDEILSIIDSLQQEESGVWIKIDADHPLPYDQEVIGYNKEWVAEGVNPSGTRVGFLTDEGFSQLSGLMIRIVIPPVTKKVMIIRYLKYYPTEHVKLGASMKTVRL